MKMYCKLVFAVFLTAFITTASAETRGNAYVGFSLSSLALDSERVPGALTRSPGHTPKIGGLVLGYQFSENWAADIIFGTDLSNNLDADVFSLNGYYFFGKSKWKPFVSAGVSSFSIDRAVDDSTQQFQAGAGVSGYLTDNLELRMAYQHYFETGDTSFNDDAVTIGLNWHFGKAKPAPVARVTAKPQPESVPVKKQVVATFELLVQFDFDKSDIKSAFKPQFVELSQALKNNPEISILIEGHTCSLGSEAYNKDLSERRSAAVKNMLVNEYGVSAVKIDTVGYGESRPVADNETKAGRQKNRRAIAVILKPGAKAVK